MDASLLWRKSALKFVLGCASYTVPRILVRIVRSPTYVTADFSLQACPVLACEPCRGRVLVREAHSLLSPRPFPPRRQIIDHPLRHDFIGLCGGRPTAVSIPDLAYVIYY